MSAHLDHALDEAANLFDKLHAIGFDGTGMTRPSYDARETAAHALIADIAATAGLEIRRDWASNLFVTLRGKDRSLAEVMTGSHLDTVPKGGNFDGAAGVLAGLAVLRAWAREGFAPARDVTLIVTRAEESVWFPVSYIGSRSAFGLLDARDLAASRRDTNDTLAAHIRAAGGTPEDFDDPRSHLEPARIDSFVELHIEQGPVLPAAGRVVGIVEGICGSIRFRTIVCRGQAAHSGATPRAFRRDPVLAAASFVTAADAVWTRRARGGADMTLTIGVCRTGEDANFSAVAGDVTLALDVRSQDVALLDEIEAEIRDLARTIGAQHGVEIDLGPHTGSRPAVMDPRLLAQAEAAVAALGIAAPRMQSGAGHDVAVFAWMGVPSLMLFVRNAHGSHNPHEFMDLEDFGTATRVLEKLLRQRAMSASDTIDP